MCKPPTECWLLVTGLPGPHSLETEGYLLPRDAQSQGTAAVCASHPLGGLPIWSFLQSPRFISHPSSKSGLVLFLLGSVPIQTHSQQDPSGSVHEKNVAFFCEAQKMQINSLLHLHRMKTGPRFGRPVLRCLSSGVLGGVCTCVGAGSWGRLR